MKKVKSMAGTGKVYLEIIPGIQFRVKEGVLHFQINKYKMRDQYIVVDIPVNELVAARNKI